MLIKACLIGALAGCCCGILLVIQMRIKPARFVYPLFTCFRLALFGGALWLLLPLYVSNFILFVMSFLGCFWATVFYQGGVFR